MSNKIINQYVYDADSKKIYYISFDYDGVEKAKIELCSEIEDCSLEYSDYKIKTKIIINSITYNDSFTLSI